MAEQRVIIEMGQGNDLHGRDYTKAARRAIEDAFRGSSLPLFGTLGLDASDMRVQVTVAVQQPEAVDVDALVAVLPRGRAEVRAVFGGMDVPSGDEVIVVATAAVEAFLPAQSGWRLKG
ncbi:Lin0512 family protein [uncultured Pseudosulfitobacter sp.]|uniref:Lin0512 family protein n=1 Tax=uncultured Pseudosulfitobacter sp. TaxID=2854214 RepID=UPI0030DA3319|tara:strand:+ start:901 stop:1257 length:357 start_codon:yes stop_codon:yes gene_type:complete